MKNILHRLLAWFRPRRPAHKWGFTPSTPSTLSTKRQAGLIRDGVLVALVEPELIEYLAKACEAYDRSAE